MVRERTPLVLLGVLALLAHHVHGSMLDSVINEILGDDKKANTTDSAPAPTSTPASDSAKDTDNANNGAHDTTDDDDDDDDDDDVDSADKKRELVAKAKENVESLENLEDMTQKEEAAVKHLLKLLSQIGMKKETSDGEEEKD